MLLQRQARHSRSSAASALSIGRRRATKSHVTPEPHCFKKLRLIAAIHFNAGRVFVRAVLTHRKYDKGDWK